MEYELHLIEIHTKHETLPKIVTIQIYLRYLFSKGMCLCRTKTPSSVRSSSNHSINFIQIKLLNDSADSGSGFFPSGTVPPENVRTHSSTLPVQLCFRQSFGQEVAGFPYTIENFAFFLVLVTLAEWARNIGDKSRRSMMTFFAVFRLRRRSICFR